MLETSEKYDADVSKFLPKTSESTSLLHEDTVRSYFFKELK